MEIQFYKPSSETLKKYIEGFYFVKPQKESADVKYWTFPNNFCIFCVNYKSEITLTEKAILTTPSSKHKIAASLVFRYNNPIEVVYEGPINEITIYFKPLGINHFVDDITMFALRKNIANYNPFIDFKAKMEAIFTIEDRVQQIELLENYWLSKYTPQNLSLIEQILDEVILEMKVSDIANKHNLSRQYINKLFIRNIGKTPSEYKKIHRFRNSIYQKQNSKNLTELSNLVEFYDQSHFIRDFKNFTQHNPLDFFNKVDTKKENVWLEL